MKKGLTELVFIIDGSGSMHGLEKDTIGGFNSMIEKQKRENGEVLVSTVIFNSESRVVYDRVDIRNIRPMTEKDYEATSCTALIDAIGGSVRHIGNVHKYIRNEDLPENTVFVITTDGMENASSRYTADEVKKMIERQKEKYGWEFIFLGANIDSVETAKSFGIGADRTADYFCDSKGINVNYACVSEAICSVRKNKKLDESWSREIKADFKKRS